MSRTASPRRVARQKEAGLADAQLTVAWQAASLLLGYPDEELLGRLGLIRQASLELPDHVGGPLRECVVQLEGVPLEDLEADYVETFDTRRRHNLFLTYFAHGDTRKRGMALLRFKQTYLASGFELTDTEGRKLSADLRRAAREAIWAGSNRTEARGRSRWRGRRRAAAV